MTKVEANTATQEERYAAQMISDYVQAWTVIRRSKEALQYQESLAREDGLRELLGRAIITATNQEIQLEKKFNDYFGMNLYQFILKKG